MLTRKRSARSRWWFGLSFLVFGMVLSSPKPICGAEGMTAEEFGRLADAEKSVVLRTAAKGWLEATQNIEYVVETRLSILSPIPSGFVKEAEAKAFSIYSHNVRRIGDSHWVHQQWWSRKSTDNAPTIDSLNLFDSATGTSKSLATHEAMRSKQATVTSEHPDACKHNTYGRIFDLGCTCSSNVPLVHLLENEASWLFLPSDLDGLIHVRLDDRHCEDSKPTSGVRDMWFDPEKGFLLIRQRRQLKAVPDGDDWKVHWEERYNVTDTVQSDGLWLPAECMMVTIFRGLASAKEMTLEKVAVGKVTRSQLTLEFPPGVDVVDRTTDSIHVEGGASQRSSGPSSSPQSSGR